MISRRKRSWVWIWREKYQRTRIC